MGTTHDANAGHDMTEGSADTLAFTPAPRRSAASRAVAATVVLTMAVGGLVLATRAGSSGDADAALTAAKAAFTDDVSYRFSFRTTEELREGDPQGAGVDTVTRTITEGEVEAPNRWSLSSDNGAGWTEESVRLDATHYRRNLDAHDASNDTRWVESEAAELDELSLDDLVYELEWLEAEESESETDLGEADRAWRAAMRSSARLGIVATGHAVDSAVDPGHLTRLVRAADDAEIIEQGDDGMTLRATVAAPEELAEAISEPLPDADVEIDLDADDRPVAVRVELAENGAVLEVDLRFSDWGAPIVVETPAEDTIDHTPGIDEDALRAAEARLLVAPAAVPEGLTLQTLKVAPGVEGCSVVTLEYWPVTDPDLPQEQLDESLSDGPYLWVNTHLESCEDTLGVGIDKSFDTELGGRPARQDWGWEVLVGDTVVSLDSNVDAGALGGIAASLAPVDADALISSVAAAGD